MYSDSHADSAVAMLRQMLGTACAAGMRTSGRHGLDIDEPTLELSPNSQRYAPRTTHNECTHKQVNNNTADT